MIRIRVHELRLGDRTESGEVVMAWAHSDDGTKTVVILAKAMFSARRATWWSADHINVTRREGANG